LTGTVPIKGYIAFVPPTDSCESAANYSRNRILTYYSRLLTRHLCVLSDLTEVDEAMTRMQNGTYHLCFTRDFPVSSYQDGTWLPSGVTFRIQEDIFGLSVNGVQHARGLRSFMPLRGSNVIEIFRQPSKPLLAGEAISLIPSSAFCADTPSACSSTNSGYLTSNTGLGVMHWGELCDLRANIYQVCHRRTGESVFRTTGLSLTLQDVVTRASINDMEMGRGHRTAAAKVATNRMFLNTNSSGSPNKAFYPSTFIQLPGDRRIATARFGSAWDEAAAYLSLIPAMADCEKAFENPSIAGDVSIQGQTHMPAAIYSNVGRIGGGKSDLVTLRASGHLSARIELQYDSNNFTHPLGLHLDEATMWQGISGLPTGVYQVCVCVKPKPEVGEKAFNSTGISVNIQNRVLSMRVNFLAPNGGVRVSVPRAMGNLIVVSGDQSHPDPPTYEGFVMSLIHPTGDCNDVNDNPPNCSRSDSGAAFSSACGPNGTSVSGFLPLASNGMVKNTQRFSELVPALYQVCLTKSSASQQDIPAFPAMGSTGITALIQDAILNFKSNGVAPGYGNRLAFPLVAGNTLSYSVLNASAAHWLSLIGPDEECKVRAGASNVKRLMPKPSWRLQAQNPFSVNWLTNDTQHILSLEVKCRADASLSVCGSQQEPGGYRLGMRSSMRSQVDGSLAWSAYEYVDYPASLSMNLDVIVTVEDNGIAIFWEGKVRHIFRHQIPWSRFGGVNVNGTGYATNDERLSHRRYEVTDADINSITTSMLAGIYQLCFSQEGVASKQSFLGETNVAIGTGISVRLQKELTGLQVNGIANMPRHHPQGVVATAPVRQGLIIRAFGQSFVNLTRPYALRQYASLPQMTLSIVDAKGACESVNAMTQCIDASCDNPPAADPEKRASGILPVHVEDASLADTNVIDRLPGGMYQVCMKSGASDGMIASGLSIELHTRIGGVWVNNADIHDGLHSVASRRDLNSIFVRGRLPSNKKSVEVSGRIAMIRVESEVPASPQPLLTCARLPKDSSPAFDVSAGSDTVVQAQWDAAWGYTGSQSSGLHELCMQRANDEPFEATGVTIDIQPAPVSKVASMTVNGVQSWGTVTLPWGVQNNEVVFELAGANYSTNMYFVLSDSTRGRTCAEQATIEFPPKISTLNAGLGQQMGRMNQSEVEICWSRLVAGLLPNRIYKVCFSENGDGGPYVDTGFTMIGQRNVSGLTLNQQFLHNGRILYLPNVTNERIAFERPSQSPLGCGNAAVVLCSFVPRPYAVGDAIALISVQGHCTQAYDNPSATTGGSSGSLFTRGEDGILDYSKQITAIGPYYYQVCIRFAGEHAWQSTGLRVEVVQNFSLRVLGLPPLASRCDVSLPTLTVRLENPLGNLVPYFDSATRPYPLSTSTRIVLHLYRCNSTCGTLFDALSTCSEACPDTNWENVTSYVTGNDAPIVDGVATYTSFTVHSNAGRFYLKAGWVRDSRLTWGDTLAFIVMPHHILTSGVSTGDQFTVGAVPAAAFEFCDLGLLSRDDVRCRGSAILPAIRYLSESIRIIYNAEPLEHKSEIRERPHTTQQHTFELSFSLGIWCGSHAKCSHDKCSALGLCRTHSREHSNACGWCDCLQYSAAVVLCLAEHFV
jgi:hypothetical protein